MTAVYRRSFPVPIALVGLVLAALAACGSPPEVAQTPDNDVARTNPYVSDRAFLETRSLATAVPAPQGEMAALGFEDRSLELLRWPPPEHRAIAMRGRPLGFAPADGGLLVGGDDPARPFFRRDPNGSYAGLPARPGSRFLGWKLGGAAFFAAAPSATDAGEDLLEVRWPRGGAAVVFQNPNPFTIGAVSVDGSLVALVHRVHPESDEIFVHRRSSDETHLVLPVGAEGRFQPLRFSADRARLWLAVELGARRRVLGHLDLASGALGLHEFPGCDFVGLRGDLSLYRALGDLTCDGRAQSVSIDLRTGNELPLPDPPEGTRWVGGELATSGTLLVAAGGRATRDLLAWNSAAMDELRPLTWLLDPAIDPRLLVEPRRLSVGNIVPGELWSPPAGVRPSAGLLWVEGDERPPAWDEFDPLFALLATRGVAVLRMRPRGSDGFGAALRHGADGAPVSAAVADVLAARTTLATEYGATTPVAIAGQGELAAAITIAALAEASDRWRCGVALGWPLTLPPVPSAAVPAEAARAWWTARWGDPSSAAYRREAELLRALDRRQSLPLLLLADIETSAPPEVIELLRARAAAGEPLSWRGEPDASSGFAALSPDGKRALLAHVESCLAAPR